MEVLGYIFLVLLVLLALTLVVTVVASIPDIRRYLAISRM
jgi:hypothetical protein